MEGRVSFVVFNRLDKRERKMLICVLVQRAVAMGKARCRIVAFDFIIDSIIQREGKVRHQNKRYHEMENVLRRLKQAFAAREIYNNTYYSQEAKTNRLVNACKLTQPLRLLVPSAWLWYLAN